jgi:hypothetical protein
MKKIKYAYLCYCFIFIQSCVTTFKKIDQHVLLDVKKNESKKNCIKIRNFALSETGPATDIKRLIDVTDLSNTEDLDTFRSILKIPSDFSADCSKNFFDANIYLKVKSKKDSVFWPLMSIITLGIIPYWDDYENLMEIELFEKGILQKKITSQIGYSQIYSLFLLPAMPFYDNVYNDFGENNLGRHAAVITQKIGD